MKGSVASTIALAAGVACAAHGHGHQRVHELLARGDGVYGEDSCITTQYCTTYVTTIYGEPTRKYLNTSPASSSMSLSALRCHDGYGPDTHIDDVFAARC